MPARISSIESHPQREDIIKALAAEQPYRHIEKWTVPTVSTGALSRFKRHNLHKLLSAVTQAKTAMASNTVESVPRTAVQSVTMAALAVAIDPFVAAAQRSAARRERWMDDLEAQPDIDSYRVLASLDKNDLAAQEYHARLANRLDSASSGNTTNNLNVYLGIPRSDPSRVIDGKAEPSDE